MNNCKYIQDIKIIKICSNYNSKDHSHNDGSNEIQYLPSSLTFAPGPWFGKLKLNKFKIG